MPIHSNHLPRTTTTNLAEIQRNPERFTWGQVVKIHEIGRYHFVEYLSKECLDGPRSPQGPQPSFQVYVDQQSTGNSCDSLEAAMVLAIARGKQEPNTARWMAQAVGKLLDL